MADAVRIAVDEAFAGFETRLLEHDERQRREEQSLEKEAFRDGMVHERLMCNLAMPGLSRVIVPHSDAEWERWAKHGTPTTHPDLNEDPDELESGDDDMGSDS